MGKVLATVELEQPNRLFTADDVKRAFGLAKGDIDESWSQKGVALISTDFKTYAIMIEAHAVSAIKAQATTPGAPKLSGPYSNPHIDVFGC